MATPEKTTCGFDAMQRGRFFVVKTFINGGDVYILGINARAWISGTMDINSNDFQFSQRKAPLFFNQIKQISINKECKKQRI